LFCKIQARRTQAVITPSRPWIDARRPYFVRRKETKMKTMVAALLLSFMASASAFGQQALGYDDRPKIAVNGEAVVNVAPDKIVITFGIETVDNDIVIAKQKNNDIMKRAIAVIKKCGVPEKEIQTDHLSIAPRWRDNYRKEDFMGYYVDNTFAVTLVDVAKVEDLVTKALQAGVNAIHGIDFQSSEYKKYREQARELALKAAKEKAEKMAGVLGQFIGAPIQISDNGSPGQYYSSWSGWGSRQSNGMSQNASQDVSGGSGETSDTIALGKISIRASVSVTFALKK
jgi:uncharacterized protein YggE